MSRLDLPPVWGALAALAIWLWARSVAVIPAPGLAPLGWALIAVGVALTAWAAVWFRRMKTPIEPRHTPSALITAGPYRLSRNPIYRGLILAVAGWALVCGELTALAVAAAYGWLLHVRFALTEEAVLRQTFGRAFEDWAARVRWRL
ncbi:MAG: isoprenylcysteine carboxylmethyltransferase family protein [Alphaproteobacteria bacterium HGW-Alphaproteobacteria-10]|nr:MAG: isoprenylcysteine carboxylmethyltransferase family protein [Alphaproteobacteria bacterium HGW-Alphaproteobacteria-10]